MTEDARQRDGGAEGLPPQRLNDNPWPEGFPADSDTFGVLASGPFLITHDNGIIEAGLWLHWKVEEGLLWAVYSTPARTRDWPITVVTNTPDGLLLTKQEGGSATVTAYTLEDFAALREATVWWEQTLGGTRPPQSATTADPGGFHPSRRRLAAGRLLTRGASSRRARAQSARPWSVGRCSAPRRPMQGVRCATRSRSRRRAHVYPA